MFRDLLVFCQVCAQCPANNIVAERDLASIGGRRLHPVASIAWIFRNLSGGYGPENGSRTVGDG